MQPVHQFTIREMNEIKLALYYAQQCTHGTAGHNRLMLIANMALMLRIDYDYRTHTWKLPENVMVMDGDGEPVTLHGESISRNG